MLLFIDFGVFLPLLIFIESSFFINQFLVTRVCSLLLFVDFGVALCEFAYSTMRGLQLICRRLGWQRTYNTLILDKVMNKLVNAVKKEDATREPGSEIDTVAIFIWLSGK